MTLSHLYNVQNRSSHPPLRIKIHHKLPFRPRNLSVTCFHKLSAWGSSLPCIIWIPRVFPSFAHLLFPSVQYCPSGMHSSRPLPTLSWVPLRNVLTKALLWFYPTYNLQFFTIPSRCAYSPFFDYKPLEGRDSLFHTSPTVPSRCLRYLHTIWQNIISN